MPTEPTLGTRAVVAGDVDEQGVIQLADVLQRLLESPDLVIGVLQEAGEHLGLACEETPLFCRQRVPRLDVLWPVAQPGVRRDHAQLLLALERFISYLVPALVELALVLVGPRLRHMVRRMDRPGGVVDEERLVRRHRLLGFHPVDGLVGHVDGEVVVLHLGRIDLDRAVVDERIPLVGLPADESVELVEPLVEGPAIKRTRHTGLPRGGFVPLAEGAGAVAVQPQHFRQGRHAVRHLPGVAGKGRRALHDRAGISGVVVPAGLERVARRRAQRRGVEVVEAQASLGQLVHGWRADGPAERAGPAEADVVDQHDHDIGGACGRLDLEPRRWLDLARVQFAIRRSFRLRDGQDRAIELLLRRNRRGGDGQREAKNGKDCYSLHVFLPLSVHRMKVDGVAHFTSSTSPSFQR